MFWGCAFFALLSPILFSSAALVKDDIEDLQDLLLEAQYNATLLQELEPLFGYEDARAEGPQKVNKNPLAYKNLFKRAGCTFLRTGEARTCLTAGDICCQDATAQDGWCCPNTDGCGPGAATGTRSHCTFRVSWISTTFWDTSTTTDYSTYTSSSGATTSWVTSTTTSWTTTSADMDTATEWVTVTSTSARAGKRDVAEPTATASLDSGATPSSTLSMPTATPVARKQDHQDLLKPDVTEAPKYIQIRNILVPRQTMRTDISLLTVTRSTYYTTTVLTTVYESSTDYTTYWTTSIGTRTAALNARTTITSTSTLYLQPGETAPTPEETPGSLSGGGGGAGGRLKKGLAGGARAGIGIGAALCFALVGALVAFCLRKRKADKSKTPPTPTVAAAGAAAGAATAPTPQHYTEAYKPPMHSPVGSPPPGFDPRYSQMTQTSQGPYGTPASPSTYGYPQQGMAAAPVPMGGSPPPQQYPQHMAGSPPPQQYAAYQYPRPPSPSLGGGSPAGFAGARSVQQPVPLQPGMQHVGQGPSEMSAVYSPHPQRPA